MAEQRDGTDHGLRWIGLPSGATVLIDPSRGGTVHRLRLSPAPGEPPIELLWGDEEPARSPVETDLFRGRPLAPFADRIKGGRYRFGTEEYQLPCNDATMGDAIHGFLYRSSLTIGDTEGEERTDSVMERTEVLAGEIGSQAGYPWRLEVKLRYILRDAEFVFGMRVRNTSDTPAPFSAGWHPYFRVPGAAPGTPVDLATLTLPAEHFYEADGDLRLTGHVRGVTGTPYDFRTPRPVGHDELDIGFPAVANVSLSYRDTALQIALGGFFSAGQIFVPPGRAAIAIEPITAPAAAFNTPELGLITLDPGRSYDGWAAVRLLTAPGE